MKLKVFHADDGDCLLLSSSDGHHALIDGGRTGTFRTETWGTLESMARTKKPIDLLVVSHIDGDHISGILWLLEVVRDWAIFDHQTTDGGNPNFPKPAIGRPPEIKKIWHNAWRDQVGHLTGPIEALAAGIDAALSASSVPDDVRSPAARRMFDSMRSLAQSITQGRELRTLIDDGTPIKRNDPFEDLVLLRPQPHVEKLGKARLTVLGPARKHLERLRAEWKKFLEDKKLLEPGDGPDNAAGTGLSVGDTELSAALAAERVAGDRLLASMATAAEIIEQTDPGRVTAPNRASIVLLAEEQKRTCLLTGDAAEEEILEGLEAAGRVKDGVFRGNVWKVQHHGAEHNVSTQTASVIVADDYVLCANGASDNPDPSVVKTLVETRLAVDGSPFTMWFNCSPTRTSAGRAKVMRAAIREATKAAAKHSRVTVKVLDDAKPFFEITV